MLANILGIYITAAKIALMVCKKFDLKWQTMQGVVFSQGILWVKATPVELNAYKHFHRPV